MHEHCISDSSRDESLSEISCKECKNNTDNKTLKVLNTKECKENMEVAAAKDKEIDKWTNYNVFDEIKEEENEEYLMTRWVITEKNKDIKARLVVRGFQEVNKPKSDAPTASRE